MSCKKDRRVLQSVGWLNFKACDWRDDQYVTLVLPSSSSSLLPSAESKSDQPTTDQLCTAIFCANYLAVQLLQWSVLWSARYLAVESNLLQSAVQRSALLGCKFQLNFWYFSNVCNVQCTMYNAQCAMNNVHCNVQWAPTQAAMSQTVTTTFSPHIHSLLNSGLQIN